jgi:hypothetical protein
VLRVSYLLGAYLLSFRITQAVAVLRLQRLEAKLRTEDIESRHRSGDNSSESTPRPRRRGPGTIIGCIPLGNPNRCSDQYLASHHPELWLAFFKIDRSFCPSLELSARTYSTSRQFRRSIYLNISPKGVSQQFLTERELTFGLDCETGAAETTNQQAS